MLSLVNLCLWFELIIPYTAKLSRGKTFLFKLENANSQKNFYGSMLVDLYGRAPFFKGYKFHEWIKRKIMETIFTNLHR